MSDDNHWICPIEWNQETRTATVQEHQQIQMDMRSTNFDWYQNWTDRPSLYPEAHGYNISYPAMGLAGEAGEALEVVKKWIREGNFDVTKLNKEKLVKELGDVLFYLARVAREIGVPLSEVARLNILKIEDRLARDKIHGSGDDR